MLSCITLWGVYVHLLHETLPRKSKTQKANLMGIGPGYVPICLWTEHYESLLSIHTRCVKCTKYQIFGIFDTPNTNKYQILDVPNLIIFATCYSILTYLARYEHLCYMILLFFYSSFSLIPLISFVFSFSYSPPLAIRMCLLLSLSFFFFLRWQVLRFFFFWRWRVLSFLFFIFKKKCLGKYGFLKIWQLN